VVTFVHDDPQHIVGVARAPLERYGFAVLQPNEQSRAEIGRQSSQALRAATLAVEWIDLFRATLVRSLQTGNASLGGLATQLLVSPRTLQRQLAAHHTSLRSEINLARRELATKLLQAGASNSVITLRLGYSDARALRRALRRWRAADDSANGARGTRLRLSTGPGAGVQREAGGRQRALLMGRASPPGCRLDGAVLRRAVLSRAGDSPDRHRRRP